MIPTRLLIQLVAAMVLAALVVAYVPALRLLWIGLACFGLSALVLDFWLARKPVRLICERKVFRSIPVGVWSKVGLELSNQDQRDLLVLLHDHHPVEFDAQTLPLSLLIPRSRMAKAGYEVLPRMRGDALFSQIELLVTSPIRLWKHRQRMPVQSQVKVFPNFREIGHYALLATDHRLSQIGIKRRQRRGEGNDFHQLREYRAGDTLHQIDWKATSRYRKLISKEYQDERDQQVLFMLDCGRRMHHAEEGRVHLDQALNAMLLLAYVAARQGDAVGFMAFGGVRRWYPPRKSADVVKQLLDQTYDLQSTTSAADYLLAAREMLPLQKRRALIVLITNTRDEEAEDLKAAIQLLGRRHLVVLADLREEVLDETLERPVGGFDDALYFNAVNAYMENRRRSHNELRHQGVLTLDLLAPQLPAALVNQYHLVKASGRL